MYTSALKEWAAAGKHPLWSSAELSQQAAPTSTLRALLPYPSKACGASIIVFPGGGYVTLAPHESDPVAEWLTTLGVVGFVLDYRLAPHAKHPAMLEDATRAVRTVRANASQWGLDPHRIGVLGFSAGGHLATTLATHFDAGTPNHADPIEQVSSRPDLVIAIYPVVSLVESYAHAWCRKCLLGDDPPQELLEDLSPERRVTSETPPMFLVHSVDDNGVPPAHSLKLALALSEANVPYELHIYQGGGHGYGLARQTPYAQDWPWRCARWLQETGFTGLRRK
ncbi:alpha/beta hydrolase [Chthonomonas calidirosea]|uniref:Esterase/lipase n=1 Tax=Chthonomonas calidirosea (strain DSM 23976 / ICMP 18418 / T49) TaxID=1303518 RepID=S0EVR1_CHTCT|nr:alpha/beta hydrolase [Chthonomonas calidirosea]CCW35527.1 Esterase/lipase [Chthonomonas calidirosea T49]CEK19019.1 esterase/lipase [Chthonomonas calidirosea]CEK20007.1 esterase/lipase [Chthonomonas calidirosea]